MKHPALSNILFDAPPSHNKHQRQQHLTKLRKTCYRDSPDSPLRNPEEALRIHNAIEKRQLCRSEIGKRSASIARERQPDSRKIAKSRSISRYDSRTEGNEDCGEAAPWKGGLHKSITSSKLFATSAEVPKLRVSTEAEGAGLKEELMRRVSRKIDFMRKMTEEEPAGCKEALFKFDKFYDHCLRNINKCLNHFDKDPSKHRSKKYFELKVEGGLLSKELMGIRHGILQRRDRQKEEGGFGIVGSNIDVKSAEKTQSLRHNEPLFRKKAKLSRRDEFSNPFLAKEMCGWEVSDKMEELLL